MTNIRRMESGQWGGFDEQGRLRLLIEQVGPIEWEVRAVEPHHAEGRGRCLVHFIGPCSFNAACNWSRKFSFPMAKRGSTVCGHHFQSRNFGARKFSG